MADFVALGESLIDMVSVGNIGEEQNTYHAIPGGAPLNFLSQLSHLGHSTAFISRVGNDMFGDMLVEASKHEKIGQEAYKRTDKAKTTLAFVKHDETGDRSFSFYRNPGADMMIEIGEDEKKLIESAKIFHVGTISMIDNPARNSTLQALQIAKDAGVKISFDPNFRSNLWKSDDLMLEATREILPYADFIKISAEEIQQLTGLDGLEEAMETLLNDCDCSLLSVTHGAKDAYCSNRKILVKEAAFPVAAVDTTGCGDSFTASMVHKIVESDKDVKDWSEEELRQAVRFANAAGAVTATKIGAMPIMPGEDEIEDFLEGQKL